MSDFEIKINDNSAEIINELKDKIPVVLEAWGLQGERYAKEYCRPVDTGRLRNSISHAEGDEEGTEVIGTNVEYAAPVEMGHILPNGKFVQPRAFLRRAAENHASEYEAIAKKILGK